MQTYGVNELRKMFLDFFESKEHLIHKSYSLVPHNDKSLLLINSGMAPLKPYLPDRRFRQSVGWRPARSVSVPVISKM